MNSDDDSFWLDLTVERIRMRSEGPAEITLCLRCRSCKGGCRQTLPCGGRALVRGTMIGLIVGRAVVDMSDGEEAATAEAWVELTIGAVSAPTPTQRRMSLGDTLRLEFAPKPPNPNDAAPGDVFVHPPSRA